MATAPPESTEYHVPHRQSSYRLPPHQSSSEAQQARRAQALELQRSRRTHAFEAARQMAASSLRGEMDSMGDLSLGPAIGQYNDADSDASGDETMPVASTSTSSTTSAEPSQSHSQKKKRSKAVYKPWARDLLTQGEVLNLATALPRGLEHEWMLKVVPEGKRCLAATGTDSYGTNTVLYSRVSGRSLARHSLLQIPPSTLLDTIYDPKLGVLWVLDLIRWGGRDFVECDGDMRSFFLASKLTELGPQPYTPRDPSTSDKDVNPSGSLLLLPCPSLSSPLSPANILPLLSSIPPASTEPLSVISTIFLPPSEPNSLPAPSSVTIPLRATGVMLYLSGAHYESGLTALAAWVPCVTDAGSEGVEGVRRFGQLVEEWRQRGGEADGNME